eukprot:GEMP01022332.1.p1 GENE.GEMP01022332.1~~GEMP01022332.1.p1  ORF type:complete len:675 (+),score=121.75 GEMP01022332.1:279-2303(+)
MDLQCLLLNGQVVPFPGEAENEVVVLDDVAWEVAGQRSFGSASLTNYRLLLRPKGAPMHWLMNLCFPLELAWGALGRVARDQDRVVDETSDGRGRLVDVIILRCTDFRIIRLLNLDPQHSTKFLLKTIHSLSRIGEDVSSPSPFVEMYGQTGWWNILDWNEEFARLGVSSKWRLCNNMEIPSYPSVVMVPRNATEEEIQTTQEARARRRYVEKCRRSVHPLARVVFFDCRSKSAVWGNLLARRGGTENAARYRSMGPMRSGDTSTATVVGWDLPNIHVMRRSYILLHRLVTQAAREDQWFQKVGETEWLEHCRKLTEAALNLARILDGVSPSQPPVCVIVHCSDGWDRTSQVCALAEVLLDPFYRTKRGLCVLIEKDWVSFGHNFRSRSRALSEGGSPIFQQWLFCLAAVCGQFPTLFEYDSKDLILLIDLFLSQWTHTLGCDSERERRGLDQTQVSLWSLWLSDDGSSADSGSEYKTDAQIVHKNWRESEIPYVPHLILPVLSMKFCALWEFVLRFDEAAFRQQKPLRTTDATLSWPPLSVWWIRDDQTITCMHCRRPFGYFRRRKHCRACGLIFCKKCCFQAELPSLGYTNPQQVCAMCFELYQSVRYAPDSSMEDLNVDLYASAEDARLWAEATPHAAHPSPRNTIRCTAVLAGSPLVRPSQEKKTTEYTL